VLSPSAGPAIAAAFGLGGSDPTLTGPVARGEQGQVWRLETEHGVFAVKHPFIAIDDAEADADAAYQELVRDRGVPLPRVVRALDGRAVVRLDGGPVRVYEWVDVLTRDRALDAAEVGGLVACIHSAVDPTGGPVPGWYVDPVGADRWRELVGELRAAGASFADELDALRPGIEAVEKILEPRPPTQRCHLDLWADNVRRTPAGGLTVLDWENSGPGEPSLELGVVLFEFGLGDPARIRDLYAAYVDEGGPGRVTGPADLTMLVAQLGHIAEIGCRRWLAATDPDERRHLEGWVREYVDEPVTLETVTTILDAVGGFSSRRRP
jgi:Ser/Thr protein kinase RdoA (MazF antagonist)